MDYIRINPADNVAVALSDLKAGAVVEGITLKTEGAEIPVTMNGTWPAEDEN